MRGVGDSWLAGLPRSQLSSDSSVDSCGFPGLAPVVTAAGAA